MYAKSKRAEFITLALMCPLQFFLSFACTPSPENAGANYGAPPPPKAPQTGAVDTPPAAAKDTDVMAAKIYIGAWDGRTDEVQTPGKWSVKAVSSLGAAASAQSPTPGPGPGSPPPSPTSPLPSSSPSSPVTSPQNSAASPGATPTGEVAFHIHAGTHDNDWNTEAGTVQVKIGVKFTIYNDDDVVHQWHTNGAPCPHGRPIQPGGAETCIPDQPYNDGPLYDHITNETTGAPNHFYISAQ